MTSTYDKLGFIFPYPENWSVAEERLDEPPVGVTLQSASSGFWSLHLFPDDTTPDQCVAEALRSMQEEYDVEHEATDETWEDCEWVSQLLNFYCLDLLVTAKIFSTRVSLGTLLFWWQGENRDYDQLEPVFRALTVGAVRAARWDGETNA